MSFLGIGLAVAFVGCYADKQATSDKSQQSAAKPLSVLSEKQKNQKKKAVAAKDKFLASLLGELIESMSENSPAESINVCKSQALEIAKSVSEETGVRIGRTSFQLRNDKNKAPQWATSFVSDRIEDPVDVELPNDGLGVLLPIRMKATCTHCHGDAEQISPDVKIALATTYPNDHATGFSEGDIRGYFWVEVDDQEKAIK